MAIAFFAGSFDPFTKGHLAVVKRAANIFDCIIIGIGVNVDKERRFDKELMKYAIESVLVNEKIENARVLIYNGFTSNVALEEGANCLIRGIRNYDDFIYEEKITMVNNKLGIDTVYIGADEFEDISSTKVIEKFRNGEDISKLVPKEVIKVIKED
jgi:pantetheine-phosphate adenylyltransferase